MVQETRGYSKQLTMMITKSRAEVVGQFEAARLNEYTNIPDSLQ